MADVPNNAGGDTPSKELIWAIGLLASGRPILRKEAKDIVATHYDILCDEETGYSWDAAVDALKLLTADHQSLIPSLCQVITEASSRTSRKRFATIWAVRALGQIGGPAAVECLIKLGDDPVGWAPAKSFKLWDGLDLSREAKKALARCQDAC